MRFWGIVLLMLFGPLFGYAADTRPDNINYQFRHLTIDNGLSHADANVVAQDRRGLIWIGTYSGLNRYDGYEIRTFYNELSHINKPYLNRVYDISVSDDGLLWLATSAGIQLFDPYREQYVPIRIENEIFRDGEYELEKILSVGNSCILVKNNENRIIMYKIKPDYVLTREPFHLDVNCFSMHKDREQRVWIGTDKGLYVLLQNNKLSHFFVSENTETGGISPVRFSFVNQDNCLLVATERNIYLYPGTVGDLLDYPDKTLTEGELLPVDLSKGWITDLVQDVRGDYWISTLKGLYRVYKEKNRFAVTSFFAGNDDYSLASDFISRLLLDRSENLFVSTYGGGVNILDLNQNRFFLIQRKPAEANTLSENIVRAISESDGCLWLGTNSAGLNCMDRRTGIFTYYNRNKNAPANLASDGIRALLNDGENKLWIGHTEGLDLINLEDRNVIRVPEIGRVDFGEVSALAKDCFNQIWVGTWSNGIGRIRKKEDGRYETILYKSAKPDYPAFTPARVITIYADSLRPEVFFSSGKQLIRLFLDNNGDVEKSLIYQANDAKKNSLSSNFVCSIARENDSILWVGCIGGGLNRMCLLPDGDYYSEAFSSQNGLDQMDIESLQMDDAGNLWLGANGLTEFVQPERKFNAFKTIDGSSVNSFKVGGSFRGKDGWLYFGGIKGAVYFNPSGITKNNVKARAAISSVFVNNQRVTLTEEMRLAYDENNITLCPTGVHYAAPEKCKFRYRLLPFEKEWQLLESGMNRINYANLPYGEYRFELLASNNDGLWSSEASRLSIQVVPPWWLSSSAKIVYVILALSFLFTVYFYLLRWFNMKKQLEIKHIQKEQSERIHQMQLQFFTNISHEFRTPLTLMMGTIERIGLSHEWKSSYGETLIRNAKRLMDLVDELIDFRKVETEGFKLSVYKQDIYRFLDKIITDFNLLATARNISFRVVIPKAKRQIWFDPEVMEKIVLNLLNNAFKYTKEGGTIEVVVDDSSCRPSFPYRYAIENRKVGTDSFCLYIRDTGVGISKDSIGKIFTRYYRIQDSDYDPHLGSGIGLALVKSLLAIHKGNLVVSSEREKGTDFFLTFPCSQEDYGENEVGDKTVASLPETDAFDTGKEQTVPETALPDQVPDAVILLVEDNDEVRNFLADTLGEMYTVWQSTDGQDALAILKQQIPDLIISDLMMPNMDGKELCRILKKDACYNSIPFNMLTAKASLEARISGMEVGADSYLAKPVSLKLLQSNIRNLLAQKKRMKESISSTYLQDAFEETILAKDKVFYDFLLRVITANLSNPDMDVNLISQQMGYSRTRLYQKVKDITGKSIMELVRQLRLRKALQIMAEEDLPISEILLKIGIMSQSYFTHTFKKEYGETPAQYMKNLRNKNPKEK